MRLFRFFCLMLVACLLAACEQQSALVFVDDQAGLLDQAQQARIKNFHEKLLKELDIHLLVATLDHSTADVDNLAIDMLQSWRLGSATAGARGLLLLIDPEGRQVRLEVGYDLEGVLPDGFVAGIEYDQMIPFFQKNRPGDGVEATVELLVARLINEGTRDSVLTRQENAQSRSEFLSGGGGAKVNLPITSGERVDTDTADLDTFLPGDTPIETLKNYLSVLRQRVKSPDLQIYTPDTRVFLRKWLITDAQQANELSSLEKALPDADVRIDENLAVIRFPIGNRQTPPYFFRRASNGWQVDLTAMGQLVIFNHLNQWHFKNTDHVYMFAFQDVRFDQYGFPH